MAPRKKDAAATKRAQVPPAPASRRAPDAPADAAPPGGTAVGWTFWSTAAECWRRWLLKYAMGLNPAKPQPYLTLGTCYHALLEGKTPAQIVRWGPDYVLALPGAKALHEARLRGPPLPKATAIERELMLLGGRMTSKPDREEGTREHRVVRDFKTSAVQSRDDSAYWDVNGEIIGEMVAAGAQSCIVDIINKRDGKVTQLEVELTVTKQQALEQLVADLLADLRRRFDEVSDVENSVSSCFPKKMTSCFGKYGQCHYYDRCWSSGAARLLYAKSPNNARWLSVLAGELDVPGQVAVVAARAAEEGI